MQKPKQKLTQKLIGLTLLGTMLCLGLTGCAASKKQFNENEDRLIKLVKVLKQEPPELLKCEYLGAMESMDGSHGGGTYRLGEFEQAMQMLQLKAAHAGANLVVLDSERPARNEIEYAYILRGRGFYCP